MHVPVAHGQANVTPLLVVFTSPPPHLSVPFCPPGSMPPTWTPEPAQLAWPRLQCVVPKPAPRACVSVRLGRGFGRRTAGAQCPLGPSSRAPAPSVASPRDTMSTARPGSSRQHRVAAPPPLPTSSPQTCQHVAREPRITRCPHGPQGGQRQGRALHWSPGPGRGGGKAGGGCRQPRHGNPHTVPSQGRVPAPGPLLGPRASRRAHPHRAGPTVEMQI